jgi:hypothetical protein
MPTDLIAKTLRVTRVSKYRASAACGFLIANHSTAGQNRLTTNHHSPVTTHQSLPETDKRVETRLSDRKQTTGYPSTRDGSYPTIVANSSRSHRPAGIAERKRGELRRKKIRTLRANRSECGTRKCRTADWTVGRWDTAGAHRLEATAMVLAHSNGASSAICMPVARLICLQRHS